MSELAIVRDDGTLERGYEAAKKIRQNIRDAREHRKGFEDIWASDIAFASGKQWLVTDRFTRALRLISDVNPAYKGRELYTADIITEYRMLALGEHAADDDRPQLLLARDDKAGEDYADQLNKALAYGWEFEFNADEALAEADRLCIDLGVSAIRCRWDPTQGPAAEENVPFLGGKPIPRSQAIGMLAPTEGEAPLPN